MIRRLLLGLLGWALTSVVVFLALGVLLLASTPSLTGVVALILTTLILAALFVLSIIKTWKAFRVGMLLGVLTSLLAFCGILALVFKNFQV